MEIDNTNLVKSLLFNQKDGAEKEQKIEKSIYEIVMKNNLSIQGIFQQVAVLGQSIIKGREVPIAGKHEILTRTSNIISNSEDQLSLWSLQQEKIIITKQVQNLSAIYATNQNTRIFLGYGDGQLEARFPNSLAEDYSIQLQSKILAIVSDEKTVFVSLKDGSLVYFPLNYTTETEIKKFEYDSELHHVFSLLKLSKDNNFLIGYEAQQSQGQFFVFELTKKKYLATGSREDASKLLVITEDSLNIFARSLNNKGIVMYSIFDGVQITQIKEMHTNHILVFLVSQNGNTVISAGKDKKIKVWDWNKKKLNKSLSKHDEPVESLVLTSNEKLLFSSSLDKTIGIWCMNSLYLLGVLQCSFPIGSILLSTDNDYILAISEADFHNYAFWALEKNQNSFRINISLKGVSNCYVTPNNDYLVTMTTNESLTIWNTKSRTMIENHQVDTQFRYNLRALNANGGGANICEFNLESQSTEAQRKFDIIKDSGWVNFELSPDNRTLVQTSQYEGRFWVVDLIENKVKCIQNKHKNVISFIAFTRDGKHFLSRSKTETIIWSTQKWNDIITIEEDFGIVTSTKRQCVAFIHDGLYKPWSYSVLKDFSDDFNEEGDQETKEDENKQKEIQIQGQFNALAPLFIDQMLQVKNQEKVYFINLLSNIVILPFKINIIHFFAYSNNENGISEALKLGCSYIKDANGNTPLAYSIQRLCYKCSAILLDYIMKEPNIYGKMEEQEIIDLIKFSPDNLREFFDNSVIIQEAGHIPQYGILKKEPNTFSLQDTPIISMEGINQLIIQNEGEYSDQLEGSQLIMIKSLSFKYNFGTGSDSSVQFLSSLSQNQNLKTFRSPVIQNILNYKWDQIKKQAYYQAIIYALYILTLFIHIEFTLHDNLSLIVLLAFGIYFLTFEGFQIFLSRWDYLQDFWNIFDMFRALLLLFYSITSLTDIPSEYHAQLLAALNAFSWLRTLSYLRLFKQTRIFINLVVQTMKDIIPFLIVLVTALLGFTISMKALQIQTYTDIIESLKHNYRLMFGDFVLEEYNTAGWILFIASSTFMTLLMLNMLIAIMSDTYSRVMQDIIPSDYFELNNMILEQEQVLFWKKNSGHSQYFYFAQYLEKEEVDEWQGQIKQLLKEVTKTSNYDPEVIKNLILKTEGLSDVLIKFQREASLKFEDQKKRFDTFSQLVEKKELK